MNKSDMSNPVQYTAYLRAYVAQRRKISSDMPAERRDGGMSGYEEGGARGAAGRGKGTQVKIYRSAVSCDRAWDALNHPRTVNH